MNRRQKKKHDSALLNFDEIDDVLKNHKGQIVYEISNGSEQEITYNDVFYSPGETITYVRSSTGISGAFQALLSYLPKGYSYFISETTHSYQHKGYITTDMSEYEPLRKCRVCGCTWLNGCANGCYWVDEDLCSNCRND